jgi:glucose dehydrogenase
MRNQCNDSNEERGHDVRTRREVLKAGAALVAAPFLGGMRTTVQAARAANAGGRVGRFAHAEAENVRDTATEWLSYGSDKANSKYSPLTQIGGGNFIRLKTAWIWQSVEEEVTKANHLKTWAWESTLPIQRQQSLDDGFHFPRTAHPREHVYTLKDSRRGNRTQAPP